MKKNTVFFVSQQTNNKHFFFLDNRKKPFFLFFWEVVLSTQFEFNRRFLVSEQNVIPKTKAPRKKFFRLARRQPKVFVLERTHYGMLKQKNKQNKLFLVSNIQVTLSLRTNSDADCTDWIPHRLMWFDYLDSIDWIDAIDYLLFLFNLISR